jgi:hypothetical protein
MPMDIDEDLWPLQDFVRALDGVTGLGVKLRLNHDTLTVAPESEAYKQYLIENQSVVANIASKSYGRPLRVVFADSTTSGADPQRSDERNEQSRAESAPHEREAEEPEADRSRTEPNPETHKPTGSQAHNRHEASGQSGRADAEAASRRDMMKVALWYASRGHRVFPLHYPARGLDAKLWCSCGKADCSSKAKHPRTEHGVKDATTDEALIKKWWKRWPEANIGIALGDGVFVLDVDPRAGATHRCGCCAINMAS